MAKEYVVSLNGSKRKFDSKTEAKKFASNLRKKTSGRVSVYERKFSPHL